MRAWVSCRAAALPTDTVCSNWARSAAVKVTRYFSMADLLFLRGALCSDTQETGSQFTRQSKIDGILACELLHLPHKAAGVAENALASS
jgi:hypothetical protein